jgi:hypothetical protein
MIFLGVMHPLFPSQSSSCVSSMAAPIPDLGNQVKRYGALIAMPGFADAPLAALIHDRAYATSWQTGSRERFRRSVPPLPSAGDQPLVPPNQCIWPLWFSTNEGS